MWVPGPVEGPANNRLRIGRYVVGAIIEGVEAIVDSAARMGVTLDVPVMSYSVGAPRIEIDPRAAGPFRIGPVKLDSTQVKARRVCAVVPEMRLADGRTVPTDACLVTEKGVCRTRVLGRS